MSIRKTEEQAISDVTKVCKEKGYTFLKFIDGFKNTYCKFEYICQYGHKDVMSYSNFVYQKCSCPTCRGIGRTLEQAIDIVKPLCDNDGYEFIGFPNGYKNARSILQYKCKIHGVIETSWNKFINGRRCGKCGRIKTGENNRKKDPDSDVLEICKDLGYSFDGYVGDYKNKNTIVKFTCPIHGQKERPYSILVNRSCGCDECNNNGGYNKYIPGYFYIFKYKLYNTDSVYKFGITNRSPKIRSNEHTKGLVKKGIVEISECVFRKRFTDGEIPIKIENMFKNYFDCHVCDWLSSGNTETISTNTNFNDMMRIIDEAN